MLGLLRSFGQCGARGGVCFYFTGRIEATGV
jgi:hypothetical protein